jgi:lactate dehydrogenase-like 2-hydroxyacid dehydrogenase
MAHEILQVSPLPPFMMKALQEADYIVHDHTHIKDPGALSKVTAVVGTGAAKVDKRLLMMLPHVKLIAICGVGYDGVDVAEAIDRGITVTHTPGVFTDDVADLAMGLVLSIGRRIPQADKFVRNGDWVDDDFALMHKVSGARLGIVGMGRIGRAIAKRAAAFDMRIAYTSRFAKADLPYTFFKSLSDLAAQVEYLVVAVPGGDDTKNLIGASVLQALGTTSGLRTLHRPANLEDLFLKLTGRQIREDG